MKQTATILPKSLVVKTEDVVNGSLWRLFPVINCDRVEAIPCDYPGGMGVPITVIDKMGRNDGQSGLQILDIAKPRLENGRELYRRFIVRNLSPDLPDEIDLADWFQRMGVPLEIEIGF